MKKYLLIILFSLVLLTGCSKKENNKNIIGTWTLEPTYISKTEINNKDYCWSAQYVFKEDNTIDYNYYMINGTCDNFSYSNDNLNKYYSYSGKYYYINDDVFEFDTDTYKYQFKVDGDSITEYFNDGNDSEFLFNKIYKKVK